jgi:hypothetical protein
MKSVVMFIYTNEQNPDRNLSIPASWDIGNETDKRRETSGNSPVGCRPKEG